MGYRKVGYLEQVWYIIKLDSRRALLILGVMPIRVYSASLWYTKARMPVPWRSAVSPRR